MFFKSKPAKSYENDLKPSVRKANQKKLYDMWGSDTYVKTKKGKERSKFRKYNMDMAAAYDKATYEGRNVNNAMQEINKKYGYPTNYSAFLSDVSAEFGKPLKVIKGAIPLSKKNIQSGLKKTGNRFIWDNIMTNASNKMPTLLDDDYYTKASNFLRLHNKQKPLQKINSNLLDKFENKFKDKSHTIKKKFILESGKARQEWGRKFTEDFKKLDRGTDIDVGKVKSTLGINSDNIDGKTLRKLRKKLMIENHPDKFTDPIQKKIAENRTKEINNAYDKYRKYRGFSSFLSDANAEFGLPKSYMQKGSPVARGVATRMYTRRTARGISQVRPSNKVIMTRTLRPKNFGLRAKLGM